MSNHVEHLSIDRRRGYPPPAIASTPWRPRAPQWSPRGPLVGIILAALATPSSAAILFNDVTAAAGVDDTGETYGQGVADLNGDLCPDIWIDHHQYTPTVILMNRCDGTVAFDQLVETPANTEGGILPDYLRLTDTHGLGIADIDGDGDQDVHEVSGAQYDDLLWLNDGIGNFTDAYADLGFVYPYDPSACFSPLFPCNPIGRRAPMYFDYDRDGDLDVMISSRGNFIAYRQPNAVFEQLVLPNGSPFFQYDGSSGVNYQSQDFCAYTTMAELSGDNVLDVLCADDVALLKVWNLANGTPFGTVGANRLGQAIFSIFPFDLAIGDFNNDGRNDIFAPVGASVNDVVQVVDGRTIHAQFKTVTTSANLMGFSFQAQGNVTFEFDWWTEVNQIRIGASGSNPPQSSDLRVDGQLHRVRFTLNPNAAANQGQPTIPQGVNLLGFWIWFDGQRWQVRASDQGSLGWSGVVVQAAQSVSNLTRVGTIALGQPTSRIQRLFIQDQNGQLVDRSNQVNMTSRACVSAAPLDADNDGDLDLAVVCAGEIANLPNVLLQNDGNGNFIEVPNAGAHGGLGYTGFAGQMPLGRGHAVLTADFDLDGRVDTFVTNGHPFRPFSHEGRQQVFRNLSDDGNRWIQLDLEGVQSNRDAIGARIFAVTPDGRRQLREIGNEMHKYSQNLRRVHFGLAQQATATIEIRWPNGLVQTYPNLSTNAVYHCTEGAGCTPVGGPTPPPAPTCGAPSYNSATERGVFLYYDCGNPQQWHARVTAGGVGTSYRGSVTSNQAFLNLIGVSQEATDSLTQNAAGTTINYIQNVGSTGYDGFDFGIPVGASACFALTSPTNAPARIGANRVSVTVPVSLTTFGACTP